MAFDERLIDLIRGKEFLYNRQHVNYRNNELKDQEWNRIASELVSTVERCKKRWGSLRDRYKRIRKHVSVSGFRKKWKHYDALAFIPCETEPSSKMDNFDDDGLITEDTIIQMEDVPMNSSPQEMKIDKNDLTEYFSSFAEEARNAVSKMPANVSTTPTDATDEFFSYLARRVKAANLGSIQEMRIEAAILNFTVEKLYEIQNEM